MTSDKILVLLVGTNPLPNYVVAKYLEEEYNRLVLICSEKTKHQQGTIVFAKNIIESLGITFHNTKILPIRDISSPKEIIRTLQENKEVFGDKNNKIILNYTGGTKAMAVYTYSFLKEEYEEFTASYLDARTFRLVYDDSTVEPIEGNLLDKIKIDIKTLLDLHNYEVLELKSWENCKFKNTVELITEKLASKPNFLYNFLYWINKMLRKFFRNEHGIIKRYTEFKGNLRQRGLNFEVFEEKIKGDIKEILDTMILELNSELKNQKGTYKNDIKNAEQFCRELMSETTNKSFLFNKVVTPIIDFLDGKWLEWYTYHGIKSTLEQHGLEEGKHFGISLRAKNYQMSTDFELDIFILNGYQLTGISVTTVDKRALCKSKGFEVLHRVKQMGGEESRAILISALGYSSPNEPLDLEKDLTLVSGSSNGSISVFGFKDLKKIKDEIIKKVFS